MLNLDKIIERFDEWAKGDMSDFLSCCLECLEEDEDRVSNNRHTREQILTEANEIVCGARNEAYGDPEDNFNRIADLWAVYLNKSITAHDVAIMMILLKVARTQSGTGSMDNYIDIAGYSACAGEIYNKGEE